MVFYFTCSDPRYTIYMGRDKYENESLIAYGWPEDLWFHVDKLSSAHVYLRLPAGVTFTDVPAELVNECAQLTKLNSIEGCKLNNVTIVYTPWANLRKTGDMATGQVGFHNRAAVRSVVIHERRNNDICNRLNKTKVEKHNNPAELFDLREQRFAREMAVAKREQKERKKEDAQEADVARAARREAEEERALSEAERAEETRLLQERIVASFAAATIADGAGGGGGGGGGGSDGGGFGGGGGFRDLLDDIVDEYEAAGGEADGGEGAAQSAASLEAVQAREAAAGKQREMEHLTSLAHARKAEAEVRAAEKLALKEQRLAEKRAAEAQKLLQRPAEMAAAAARAAELLAAARAAAAAGATAEVVEENAGAQADERIVLESMFGEEECTLRGGDEGDEAPSVRLAVSAADRSGAERGVTLRCVMPPEYPSHLPPACYVEAEGLVAAEAAYLQDQLTLYFFDQSAGDCVVALWAEWLRDEWIAKQ